MSQDLQDFDRMDDDDVDRSYQWLRQRADKQVERERARKDYLTYLAKGDTKVNALAAKGAGKGEAGAEAPVDVGQCHAFARDGKVSRGDACRFLHGTTVPSGAKGKGKGKAKGKKGKRKGAEKTKDGTNGPDKRKEMECCGRSQVDALVAVRVRTRMLTCRPSPLLHARVASEVRATVAMSVGEVPDCSMVTHEAERIWLLDSGSDEHLRGLDKVSERERETVGPAAKVKKLGTASGEVTADQAIAASVRALGNTMLEPYVLKDCPDVLSMVRLAIDDGFAVHWTREGGCQLVRPDGRIAQMTMERHVPTLKSAVAKETIESTSVCHPCEPDVKQEEAETSSWCAPALGIDAEADVAEGDVMSREERLRAEAVSVRHLMTHLPRNPYCGACAEAKIRAHPARRHDPELKERPGRVGDLVYADHLILSDEERGVMESERPGRCSTWGRAAATSWAAPTSPRSTLRRRFDTSWARTRSRSSSATAARS